MFGIYTIKTLIIGFNVNLDSLWEFIFMISISTNTASNSYIIYYKIERLGFFGVIPSYELLL